MTSLVGAAFLAVVAHQLGAQPPRLHAHDRVGARIERLLLAEHLDADDVFLQLVAAAGDGFEHDECEEALEPIALLEGRAGENPFELLRRHGGGLGLERAERRVRGMVTSLARLGRYA